MRYNTIPFVNPTNDVFVGRYDGEDYEIGPQETYYWPSFLSKHFYKQLSDKMLQRALKVDRKIDKENYLRRVKKE